MRLPGYLLGLLLVGAACTPETTTRRDQSLTTRPAIDSALATPPAAYTVRLAGEPYEGKALADTALRPAELKPRYVDERRYDFSLVWSGQTTEPLGCIGDRYERLRVVILGATPDSAQADLYHLTGRTKVQRTVNAFTGTLQVRHVRERGHPLANVAPELRPGVAARGVVVADCKLYEDRAGQRAGIFTGVLTMYWSRSANERKIYPDVDADVVGDSNPYINNAFVGEWRSYDGKLHQYVRWGEGRIPDSGALDIGESEFMPAPEYERYGWRSYADAMRTGDERAWEREHAQWW